MTTPESDPSLSTKRLKGQVAIVTGGASGIGAAAVRLFAAHGATVLIADEEVARFLSAMSDLQGVSLTLEDVAEATLFLASAEARFISSHRLLVDGGLSVTKGQIIPLLHIDQTTGKLTQ